MRTIIVNGEEKTVNASTLDALLDLLDYEARWVATAVNGELIRRSDRKGCMLTDGDSVEILSPMQGG